MSESTLNRIDKLIKDHYKSIQKLEKFRVEAQKNIRNTLSKEETKRYSAFTTMLGKSEASISDVLTAYRAIFGNSRTDALAIKHLKKLGIISVNSKTKRISGIKKTIRVYQILNPHTGSKVTPEPF
jgi:hypothetical protein